MSKKKLDVSTITNELRGQSVYFPKKPKPSSQEQEQVTAPIPSLIDQQSREPENVKVPSTKKEQSDHDTVIPRHHDTKQPSDHDTTVSQNDEDIFEIVRKAVKQIGKEAATQRLTLEEKQALDDIEYTYRRQGMRTSGNEIVRIAINYLIVDYRKNGENGILASILKRLNS